MQMQHRDHLRAFLSYVRTALDSQHRGTDPRGTQIAVPSPPQSDASSTSQNSVYNPQSSMSNTRATPISSSSPQPETLYTLRNLSQQKCIHEHSNIESACINGEAMHYDDHSENISLSTSASTTNMSMTYPANPISVCTYQLLHLATQILNHEDKDTEDDGRWSESGRKPVYNANANASMNTKANTRNTTAEVQDEDLETKELIALQGHSHPHGHGHGQGACKGTSDSTRMSESHDLQTCKEELDFVMLCITSALRYCQRLERSTRKDQADSKYKPLNLFPESSYLSILDPSNICIPALTPSLSCCTTLLNQTRSFCTHGQSEDEFCCNNLSAMALCTSAFAIFHERMGIWNHHPIELDLIMKLDSILDATSAIMVATCENPHYSTRCYHFRMLHLALVMLLSSIVECVRICQQRNERNEYTPNQILFEFKNLYLFVHALCAAKVKWSNQGLYSKVGPVSGGGGQDFAVGGSHDNSVHRGTEAQRLFKEMEFAESKPVIDNNRNSTPGPRAGVRFDENDVGGKTPQELEGHGRSNVIQDGASSAAPSRSLREVLRVCTGSIPSSKRPGSFPGTSADMNVALAMVTEASERRSVGPGIEVLQVVSSPEAASQPQHSFHQHINSMLEHLIRDSWFSSLRMSLFQNLSDAVSVISCGGELENSFQASDSQGELGGQDISPLNSLCSQSSGMNEARLLNAYGYAALRMLGVSLFGRKECRIPVSLEIEVNRVVGPSMLKAAQECAKFPASPVFETIGNELGILLARLFRRSTSRRTLEWTSLLNVLDALSSLRHSKSKTGIVSAALELAAIYLHTSLSTISDPNYSFTTTDFDYSTFWSSFLLPVAEVGDLLGKFRDVLPSQVVLGLMEFRFQVAEPWRGLGQYCEALREILKHFFFGDERPVVRNRALGILRDALWTYFRIYDDTIVSEVLLPALKNSSRSLEINELLLIRDIAGDLAISNTNFRVLLELLDSANLRDCFDEGASSKLEGFSRSISRKDSSAYHGGPLSRSASRRPFVDVIRDPMSDSDETDSPVKRVSSRNNLSDSHAADHETNMYIGSRGPSKLGSRTVSSGHNSNNLAHMGSRAFSRSFSRMESEVESYRARISSTYNSSLRNFSDLSSSLADPMNDIHLISAHATAYIFVKRAQLLPAARALDPFRSLLFSHLHSPFCTSTRLYVLRWLRCLRADPSSQQVWFLNVKADLTLAVELLAKEAEFSRSACITSPLVFPNRDDVTASAALHIYEEKSLIDAFGNTPKPKQGNVSDDEVVVLPMQELLSQLLIRIRKEENMDVFLAACECLIAILSDPLLVRRCDLRSLMKAICDDISGLIGKETDGELDPDVPVTVGDTLDYDQDFDLFPPIWCSSLGVHYGLEIINVLTGYHEMIGEKEVLRALELHLGALNDTIRGKNWSWYAKGIQLFARCLVCNGDPASKQKFVVGLSQTLRSGLNSLSLAMSKFASSESAPTENALAAPQGMKAPISIPAPHAENLSLEFWLIHYFVPTLEAVRVFASQQSRILVAAGAATRTPSQMQNSSQGVESSPERSDISVHGWSSGEFPVRSRAVDAIIGIDPSLLFEDSAVFQIFQKHPVLLSEHQLMEHHGLLSSILWLFEAVLWVDLLSRNDGSQQATPSSSTTSKTETVNGEHSSSATPAKDGVPPAALVAENKTSDALKDASKTEVTALASLSNSMVPPRSVKPSDTATQAGPETAGAKSSASATQNMPKEIGGSSQKPLFRWYSLAFPSFVAMVSQLSGFLPGLLARKVVLSLASHAITKLKESNREMIDSVLYDSMIEYVTSYGLPLGSERIRNLEDNLMNSQAKAAVSGDSSVAKDEETSKEVKERSWVMQQGSLRSVMTIREVGNDLWEVVHRRTTGSSHTRVNPAIALFTSWSKKLAVGILPHRANYVIHWKREYDFLVARKAEWMNRLMNSTGSNGDMHMTALPWNCTYADMLQELRDKYERCKMMAGVEVAGDSSLIVADDKASWRDLQKARLWSRLRRTESDSKLVEKDWSMMSDDRLVEMNPKLDDISGDGLATTKPDVPLSQVQVDMKSLCQVSLVLGVDPESMKDSLFSLPIDELRRALSVLDRLLPDVAVRIGVVYISRPDEDEASVLSHREGSRSFSAFLHHLGSFIKLSKKLYGNTYSGGLDISGRNIDGEFMLRWEEPGLQSVFHVTTLMPNNEKSGGARWKKRHIGNDHVNIVWVEYGELEIPVDTLLRSQFNSIHIMVAPLGARYFRVLVKINRPEHMHGEYIGPLIPGVVYIFDYDNLSHVASMVRQTAVHASTACARSMPHWYERHQQIVRLNQRGNESFVPQI